MASLARLNRASKVAHLLFTQKHIVQGRNVLKLSKIHRNPGENCFDLRLSHIFNNSHFPGILTLVRLQSTESVPNEDDYHSIIKNTEKPIGSINNFINIRRPTNQSLQQARVQNMNSKQRRECY